MINQILNSDIRDALYAANAPSATNKVVTDNDIIGGTLPIPPQGELLFTANVVDTRTGPGAMTTVQSITYLPSHKVVDGRSRRITYVANYSKTVGVSTTATQFIIGGITIPIPSSAIGNAARTNDSYRAEVLINFRSGNQAYASVEIKRFDSAGALVTQSFVKNVALGTWDKTIANTVALQWRVVTGAGITHTLTIQQIISELI